MTDDTARSDDTATSDDVLPTSAAAAAPEDAPPTAEADPPPPPRDRGDVELLALIDRLAAVLERSDLTELEVESGGTALVLRKPVVLTALAPVVAPSGPATSPTGSGPAGSGSGAAGSGPESHPAAPGKLSVKAPLTGIFYASPTPGSAPYVKVGGDVAVGQIVGLIEAMKLFNEIKSDLAGRVVKVIPESGTLVKARQPLLEVDPL